MFAWLDIDLFEKQLMDELLTTALEWGDYEFAIELLEKSKSNPMDKDLSKQTVFTKLHLLGIIYERQNLLTLAEKIYGRALSCIIDETCFDPVEISLFLKNYSSCLRKLKMDDLADGFETVIETYSYSCYNNFLPLMRMQVVNDYPETVANVA
jgi:hypothetical protein